MIGLFIAFEFNLTKDAKNTESGIAKKVRKQFDTFKEAGITMKFLNPYYKCRIMNRKFRKRLPFFSFTKWDDVDLYKEKIDFLYIRKPWHMDGDLIFHLRKFKKINPNSKVVLEIPTYPYDKESQELINYPLIYKDKFWRKFLKKYVDRIATYSDDDIIFGVPTLKISNAMDVQDTKIANNKLFNPSEIHVMLCATLCYWHGYDRAIYGLSEYYKKNGQTNYILHMVGDGDESGNYEKLVSDLNLKNHVIMHGRQFGEQLDDIYLKCDIAFDSMGRHRSGVEYNSSLKGKEYAAKGLPIISGVRTEFDKEPNYKYYLRVPADETAVDFFLVDKFCNKCYENGVECVRNEIRDYAQLNFTYKATMQKIVSFFIG